MKRTLIALAGAAVALLTVATSAFAWQSRIEGKPRSFEAGSTGGYYFWHDGDGLHLWTTDPEGIDSHYTGTITTDGRFESLTLEHPEGDDSATIDGAGTLTFDLHTASGIDGLNFKVHGGMDVRLDLSRDGHQTGVDHIFLGAFSVHPDHDPFTVTR